MSRSAVAALLLALLVSSRAHAGDDDRAARVGRLLRIYADDERRERILLGTAGLVASSATIATGAYLLAERQQYGPTWVALAGWLNAGPPEYVFVRSLVYLFLPGPLEGLDRHFGAELATAGPCADLTRLELAWQSAASRARKFRYANAVIYALIAGGTLGYGAYLVASHPLESPPQEGQYIIGAELIVAGLAHGGHALHDALMPSAVERAWKAHLAGFTDPPRARAGVLPFASVGPLGVLVGAAGWM